MVRACASLRVRLAVAGDPQAAPRLLTTSATYIGVAWSPPPARATNGSAVALLAYRMRWAVGGGETSLLPGSSLADESPGWHSVTLWGEASRSLGVPALLAARAYCFDVAAVNSYGMGNFSDTACFNTSAATPPRFQSALPVPEATTQRSIAICEPCPCPSHTRVPRGQRVVIRCPVAASPTTDQLLCSVTV